MSSHVGPRLRFSDRIHADKYRMPGEDFREAMNRIASSLSDDKKHFHEFREILLDMRFLPGGRIQSSIGSNKNTTALNCYVSGAIEDSFVEGTGSIMNRAVEAAATMRMGGGIGYDFSTLRPHGALIKKLGSQSSGPISFMNIYDAICKCVASSGHRRGAQMGWLRIDHPDIEAFIKCKQNSTALTGFNISVAVTDYFMECLETGRPFPLSFGGEVYREVDPALLWDQLMRSTWDWAEPGVAFVDTMNRMNNLWYCERIIASNPCGEQPLPPYGACLLGSYNLVRYLRRDAHNRWYVDLDQLSADIPIVVRAMDNVVDKSRYPLYEQEKESRSKRRMGLGVTGLSNCVEALGYPYGSPAFQNAQRAIQAHILNGAYQASARLAAEKGSFPLYDANLYLSGQFVKTLTDETRSLIARHGIRNSHLTSIAPTGTISLAADNVSSGIEPVFAYEFDRMVVDFDGNRIERVSDYGVRELGVRGRIAADVTIEEHLAVLTVASHLVDSAVSKTCNVPTDVDWESFKGVYAAAWRNGCKGCTTFRLDGRRGQVLSTIDEDEEPKTVCYVDAATGRKECE